MTRTHEDSSRQERRHIARVNVYDDLSDTQLFTVQGTTLHSFAGAIENISLGGMFVSTKSEMRSFSRLLAEIQFPGAKKRVRYEGKVVYTLERDRYFRSLGFGISFDNLPPQARRALRKYIVEQLTLTQQRHQIQILQKRRGERSVPVEDMAQILGLIDRAARAKTALSLLPQGSNRSFEGAITSFDPSEIYAELERNDSSHEDLLHRDRRVTVVFNVKFNSVFFDTQVKESDRLGVRLALPDVLYINEKREQLRQNRLSRAEQEQVEIPLPFPKGEKLERPILERTDSGFSFRVELGDPYFLPGTPLPSIRIKQENNVVVEDKGVVRHVSQIELPDGALVMRVGVETGLTRQSVQTVLDAEFHRGPSLWLPPLSRVWQSVRYFWALTLSKLRRRRRLGRPRHADVVRYTNDQGQELVGLVNRTFVQRRKVPVVVIPTAFSRRKESTSALALMLVENFARNYQHVAVLRFDHTNTVGESHIDPENRSEGKECLHFTTSGTLRDLEATLKFASENRLFQASEFILVSFSLNSLQSRKLLLDTRWPISYWIAPMGVADAQDVVRPNGPAGQQRIEIMQCQRLFVGHEQRLRPQAGVGRLEQARRDQRLDRHAGQRLAHGLGRHRPMQHEQTRQRVLASRLGCAAQRHVQVPAPAGSSGVEDGRHVRG